MGSPVGGRGRETTLFAGPCRHVISLWRVWLEDEMPGMVGVRGAVLVGKWEG
jgi:hypothetical protein